MRDMLNQSVSSSLVLHTYIICTDWKSSNSEKTGGSYTIAYLKTLIVVLCVVDYNDSLRELYVICLPFVMLR